MDIPASGKVGGQWLNQPPLRVENQQKRVKLPILSTMNCSFL
jgi:hypothetical protein